MSSALEVTAPTHHSGRRTGCNLRSFDARTPFCSRESGSFLDVLAQALQCCINMGEVTRPRDVTPEIQVALRSLPSIDELLIRESLKSLFTGLSRAVAVQACRDAVARVRSQILDGALGTVSDDDVRAALVRSSTPKLRAVINATGVVLHTNLGRAPLSSRAVDRIASVARGYSNIELNLDSGERGSRYAPLIGLLTSLTGAESALVVNNCAAAVLLALSALGAGREAIVSRGELVEIGGGFRVPDVMRQSQVRLVEVGTTNRTRLADYANAISEQTALLVKVHRSNFAIVGFTEEASTAELSGLAHERNLVMFEDLGSGQLTALHAEGLTSEPSPSVAISAGADLVAFSGDKLLGGPQAGILVGKKAIIEKLEKHPLNRALRIDKLTVAALEATLELYRDGLADQQIPIRAMLSQSSETLKNRAFALAALLERKHVKVSVVACESQVGGGSMPLAAPPSFAVAVETRSVVQLHDRLRTGAPPIVARVADEQLWLDVRCLADGELELVADGVARGTGGLT